MLHTTALRYHHLVIEQRLADFVHTATHMVLGTRDAKLRPHGAHAMGCRVDCAAGTVTVFAPLSLHTVTLDDVRATKVATVVVGGGEHHETYQFKGEVTEVRAMTEADGAVQGAYLAKLATDLTNAGLPFQDWTLPPVQPGMAVVVRVTDIFVQTPGPGAGARIGP